MRLLSTRPIDFHSSLAEFFHHQGDEVVAMPLFEFQASLLQSVERHLHSISHHQLIFCVSPTAARIGLNYLRQLNLDINLLTHKVVTVGKATQAVFMEAGIDAICSNKATSEGLLALSVCQSLNQGQSVMIWRGYEGRELLDEVLQQRGICVESVYLYRRVQPLALQQQWQQLQHQSFDRVLISSKESWQRWLDLVGETYARYRYVVFGEHFFQFLMTYLQSNGVESPCRGSRQVLQLSSLHPNEIWQTCHEFDDNPN